MISSIAEGDIRAGVMVYNLRFAAAMCRAHYSRVKEPLPDANDLFELGRYWKKYYNTEKGAGTVDEFVSNYLRYIKHG